MKTPTYLLLGGASVLFSSCGALKSVQQPLSNDGSFDPLNAPGSQPSQAASSSSNSFSAPTTTSYTPGQWVETSMPNTTFFRVIPKGNATADKVLQAGVPLKFISSKGSYVNVELDSGQVGYIPEIMVIERTEASTVSAPSAPPLPPVEDTIPTSGPVDPPSVLPPAPDDSASSVLPDIPTIPNEAPVIPPVQSTPPAPSVPGVPSPAASSLPAVPSPPAVDGITVPGATD